MNAFGSSAFSPASDELPKKCTGCTGAIAGPPVLPPHSLYDTSQDLLNPALSLLNQQQSPRYFECRLLYHEACFKCGMCKESLQHKPVYLHNGQFVCGSCYPGTCSKCSKVLAEGNHLKVGDRQKYHISCLRCDLCDTQIKDKFYREGNRCYCPPDYMRQFLQCATCRQFITPVTGHVPESGPMDLEYVTFENAKYHLHCFACNYCKRPIEETSEGIRQFFSLNGTKCCRQCINRFIFTGPTGGGGFGGFG